MTEELISGGLGERLKPLVCKTSDGDEPSVSSNLTPSANFAVLTGALTPARTFNHTAEAIWPSNQKYRASAVSFPIGETQWKPKKKHAKIAACK